jgi:uncharacterized protein involved in exopolysaccharide biosynthesis
MTVKPDLRMNGGDPDAFDVRKSWEGIKHACYGHKLLILITCLLTLAVVVAYIVIWPPVYQGVVMLAADSDKDMHRDDFYQFWNVFRKDHLPDEGHLMTSAPVIEKVVDQLELTYTDVYHPFLSHATYLWTESTVGKTYRRAKAAIFPKDPSPYAPTPEEIDRARTIHDFQRGVVLDAIPETNIGRLIVRGPSPRVAQIADTVIKTYLDERQMRHVREAEKAYESLYPEVEKARTELDDVELAIEKYYAENSILLMFEKDKVEIAQWLEMQGSIVETESVIATLQKSLEEINAQLEREEREVVSSRVFQQNGLRASLKDRLTQLELSQNEVLARFRPESPEAREIDEQITLVKSMIEQEQEMNEFQTSRVMSATRETLRQRKGQLEADLEGARAGLEIRLAATDAMEGRVSAVPEKMKVSRELGRERDILEKKYMLLQDKLMTAAASRAAALSAPPSMRVVEFAVPPEKPVWPKTKLLLVLAVAVGLMAGVGLALLVDFLYARVSRHLHVEGKVPIYAIVGQDRKYVEKLFAASASRGRN